MFEAAYLIMQYMQYKKTIKIINKNKSIKSTSINAEKEEHNRCSICSNASTVLM